MFFYQFGRHRKDDCFGCRRWQRPSQESRTMTLILSLLLHCMAPAILILAPDHSGRRSYPAKSYQGVAMTRANTDRVNAVYHQDEKFGAEKGCLRNGKAHTFSKTKTASA
jgi:hypothetical protein